MNAIITDRETEGFTVTVTIPYASSMLEFEEKIQDAVNDMGRVSTQEALSHFDSDGTPLIVGNQKLFSKGAERKVYQTPYGPVPVSRHCYQSSSGGKTYCPLEQAARIVVTSTPKFARMISSKYADLGSSRVLADMEQNHGRKVTRSQVQNIAEAVSAVLEAKEDTWRYAVPELDSKVASVSIGMDGTCMLLCEDGYREAMVGTIALYDKNGDRMHTIYTAASPEYGKETFLSRFEQEIVQIKDLHPKAIYIGLADGASCNWQFLKKHTEVQTLDFWHVSEYLAKAASVMFRGTRRSAEREEWLEDSCHKLKHNTGGAARLLTQMTNYRDENKIRKSEVKKLDATITYFENHKPKMKYSNNIAQNLPIGSGVTEAGCKVIVKQRMCGSSMKWKDRGASTVLRLRTINYTKDRWGQFWNKVSRYGVPLAA